MAHELAHCRHPNHSAEFYQEMDVIQTKLEAENGATSDTFHGDSKSVGTIIISA